MRKIQAALVGLGLVFLLTACPGTVSLTAPSGVTATPELSAIDVSWQDESDNEQGFVIYRASSNGDFAQLAEVGPNVTSYRDTALEADVVYRYAVAAKGPTQNSAQTVQAEAGVSLSYHGEAVRSFTGEVADYSAGQAQLTAVNFIDPFGSLPLGTGNVSAQGEFNFTYNATVANPTPFPICATDTPESALKVVFSPALFIGGSSGPTGGIVLASSQVAAERALSGLPGEVGDVAAVWWYVAKDTTYQVSKEACDGVEYDLELKAGWNTVVLEVTGVNPMSGLPIGTAATAVPPADLNWYFATIPEAPRPYPRHL